MVSNYFEKRYIEPVIRLTAAQLINKKETLYSRQWTYIAYVFLWGFYVFEKNRKSKYIYQSLPIYEFTRNYESHRLE